VAREFGPPMTELDLFQAWLPQGRIDQKREDALEMLRVMNAQLSAGLPPKQVDFKFENTVVWSSLVNSAGFLHTGNDGASNIHLNAILAELWSKPELFLPAYQYATIRHLVCHAANQVGKTATAEQIAAIEKAFRSDRSLADQEAFEAWLKQNRMTQADFDEMILCEALLHEPSLSPWPLPHRWLLDWLRTTGQFESIAASVREKHGSEDGAPLPPDWRNPEVATEALLQWYLQHLAAPDPFQGSAARASLPYLRQDWETFMAAIVRRHHAKASTENQE